MLFLRGFLWVFCLQSISIAAKAQRQYAANSALASGNWYKLSVKDQGVHKIDYAFLTSLGINQANISSASIRLFGNGGSMLPENNLAPRADDLVENSIQVIDGGDGIFNPGDYLLLYAPGPDIWLKDSINQRFRHQKNLYSDVSYYFLSIGGNGKRIPTKNVTQAPNVNVSTYNERTFHETDAINFLKSGREWFGEEFSNTPGNSVNRSFTVNLPNLVATIPVTTITHVVSRSVGSHSRFNVQFNNQASPPITLPAVSGNFLDAFASQAEQISQSTSQPGNQTLSYTYVPGSFNGQGWLNWFEVHARSNLSMSADQLTFRDWTSVSPSNIAQFTIQNTNANTQVWDITNPLNAEKLQTSISGNSLRFINDAPFLREYIAFSGNTYLFPQPLGKVNNQNLHNSSTADYLIVTPSQFLAEADKLAKFHLQQNSFRVIVATTEQIFNEFAGGSPDPSAIRDFAKMYFDKAGSDTTRRPKYLLLFGDASFDYKNRVANNTNYVPCYESPNSLDPLGSYTSDDFFSLLDNTDDINLVAPPGLPDIGVGRLPVNSLAQAKTIVDKIIRYHSPASLGPWRNQLTFVADDEDANLHLQDAELISSNALTSNPLFNQNKIYLDAYRQESGSGGSRYPAANQSIINQMFNGNLIWNYNGHGGNVRLADEAILDQDVIKQFNNAGKLPLFITATCDFAPYDDPTLSSIGENLLLADEKGVIALTTTTRLVFAFSNRIINDNFLKIALQPDANGKYLPLGDALRRAKILTYNISGDIINNRKFTLLGDPAMRLAFPEYKINITSINGNTPAGGDTLKALSKYNITGQITDFAGSPLNSFSGTIYPTIFDKAQPIQTLSNDASSPATAFSQQNNVIYKGKASVINGQFAFSFIVPKDINYQVGNGKISSYTENGIKDGNGVFTNFKIGGATGNAFADQEGPNLKPYLNDEKFVNGGLTNETPVLIIKLADSSGINTVGTGIGHDLTVIIDGDERNVLVMNDFYQADLDSYQKGMVRFQLPLLSNGPHSLKIKVWDVANNSSEEVLDFVVAQSNQLQLSHVLNYPNPFTSTTNFWFEHNQPGTDLKVLIQIFSVSGKLVHQIQRIINSPGNRSSDIEWNGTDVFNNKVGRGVYIYKLSVTGADGKRVEKTEKLYLL